jgi:hypothetical protein
MRSRTSCMAVSGTRGPTTQRRRVTSTVPLPGTIPAPELRSGSVAVSVGRVNRQDSCGKILEANHLGGDVTTVTG